MTAVTAPGVRVHPRLRGRRVATRRAEGRRRLHRVVAALAGITFVALAGGLVFSPFLAVHQVAVTGAGPERAAVLRAAHVDIGSPLLLFDAGGTAAAVRRLPQVASARVERRFPTGVAIHVTLRVPAAWAPTGAGAFAILDGQGVVIGVKDTPPAGLPALAGLSHVGRPGTRATPGALAAAAAALPAALRARVGAIALTPIGLVATVVGGGPELRFGDATRLGDKTAAALAVLGALTRPAHYIDVSVLTAPVAG